MRRSTQRLEEELSRLPEQLEVARNSQSAVEKGHAAEGAPETGVTQEEGRRKEANRLRERRARLVKELERRAVEEQGWATDRVGGVEEPGTGRAGRLRIGPHPLLPERGYVIYDRGLETVAWVRRVPTPARAAELLSEHGVPWEEELISHGLSPVPEEDEEEGGNP